MSYVVLVGCGWVRAGAGRDLGRGWWVRNGVGVEMDFCAMKFW